MDEPPGLAYKRGMGKAMYREVGAALDEAPFDPAAWPRALDAVARACGAASAQLLSFGPCRFDPVIAPGFSGEDIAAFLAIGGADPQVNHGLRAVRTSRLHAVVADAEYLPDGKRNRDRLYNEFFRRFDGDYVASGTVAGNADAVCNLNLFLPRRSGGLGEEARRTLRLLLPRFTDALRLSLRLQDAAVALMAGAWDALGETAVVCTADCKVLHASPEAERLLATEPSLRIAGGRLEAAKPDVSARLREAVRAAADPLAPGPRSLSVRTARGGLVLEAAPLPLSLPSAICEPRVLLLLRRLDATAALDHGLLEDAFGLSPAEREVASGIMRRLSSREIARMRGVSVETVNSQAKSLLVKTGCANRAALTLRLQAFVHRGDGAKR